MLVPNMPTLTPSTSRVDFEAASFSSYVEMLHGARPRAVLRWRVSSMHPPLACEGPVTGGGSAKAAWASPSRDGEA